MIERKNIDNENEMLALGQNLAAHWHAPLMVYLLGDLGAGKTTLVRGWLRGLGYQGIVKSPTYTLVESYHFAGQSIHHFDLYRLTDPEELYYIGLEEYLQPQSICLVEWPQQGKGVLPAADIIIEIAIKGSAREVMISQPSVR
jgi:tRNA threonylcarbamoyladenosine biosynthesis protein TsaE